MFFGLGCSFTFGWCRNWGVFLVALHSVFDASRCVFNKSKVVVDSNSMEMGVVLCLMYV